MSEAQDRPAPAGLAPAPVPGRTDEQQAPAAGAPRRAWIWTVLRLAVLAAACGIAWAIASNWNAWTGASANQQTNDAYIAADLTPMSARVAGLVRDVPIQDFQVVRKGDLLAQIADDDYRAQVQQAEADLAAAQAALANVKAQRDLQHENIAAAGAAVRATQAALDRDTAEAERQRSLLQTGIAGTRQAVERADAGRRSDQAELDRGQAQVRAAFAQIGILDAQIKQADATIQARQAQVDLARINLGYTRIIAPADGMVGQRQVRPGQYVGIGTLIVAVVPLPNVWVVANYKETQLTNIAPGQPATVRVDAFPGRTLRGHVESYAPASGSQFSLLPPDNATGNFTKVVQRIPVKIVFDDAGELGPRLRPGMSVTATVHTRASH